MAIFATELFLNTHREGHARHLYVLIKGITDIGRCGP